MVKAVIFDMDGVITDSEPLWAEAIEEQFRLHGIVIRHNAAYNQFVNKHVRGRSQKHAINAEKKRFNIKGSYQQLLNQRLRILFSVFDKKLTAIPGTIPMIKKLYKAGYPLAIASSSPPRAINYILNRYHLKKYFKVKVSGDDFKKSKPHPEIFLKCAKLLKVNPRDILVFEDSISGIQAAHRAKMKCIAVRQPYTPKKYLTTTIFVYKNLNQISLAMLNKL